MRLRRAPERLVIAHEKFSPRLAPVKVLALEPKELDVSSSSLEKQKLFEQLRFATPLKARARLPLIKRLQKSGCCEAARSNLLVTNVFDAGQNLGLLCELDLTEFFPHAPFLVVSLDHLALDGRFALDRKSRRHRRRLARIASQAQ